MVEDIHGPIRPVAKRHRKLVVVVDDSPESKVAIRFAAARAVHITGGGLILFHCIRPGEFQHWMAVADRMREEAFEEAEELLSGVGQQLNDYCGVEPETIVLEGDPAEELIKYLNSRNDIFGLVLGASEEGGPGPLVDYVTSTAISEMPCPVFIIPGKMTYDEVDEMA